MIIREIFHKNNKVDGEVDSETFPIVTLIEEKHLRNDGHPPETLVDSGNLSTGTPAQYGKELCQDGTNKLRSRVVIRFSKNN
jgi:hypothetical protein